MGPLLETRTRVLTVIKRVDIYEDKVIVFVRIRGRSGLRQASCSGNLGRFLT